MLLIRRRATALGLTSPPGAVLGGLAVTSAVTLAVGPAIGGLLIGWFDWRAAFLINVPVAILAFTMALRWIAKDADRLGGRSARELAARIDLPGVVAFAVAITALLVFLISLPALDWVALSGALVAGAGLVVIELRARNPFVDIRLLASNGALTRTYVRYCLTLLGIYVVLYGLTQWIEAGRGLSAYQAGLALIPMGLLSAITARVVSRSATLRPSLIVSAIALIVGAAGTLFLTSRSPLIAIIGVTALFGLVAGFGNVTNQAALYRESPPEKVGTAAGLLRTFGYVGSIAAATITGIAFRVRVDDSGLHRIAATLVGIGIIVLLMTVLDGRLKQ
jgi:predicted MFS family arabinose efflux permease